jgi:hypothetical protein
MNMKIEKPILVPMNNDLTMYYQQSCNIRTLETAVISLVDVVNSMQTKEEPNPEPKTLRDGDVKIGNQSGDPYIIDKNSGRILYMKHKEDFGARHVTYGFNLYDLAAAVQRGEKVVTLTKEEMNSIIKDYKALTNCHRTSADDKLRAAMGGGQ